MSEELVVKHCSPTLAGLKTANMFACHYVSETELKDSVRKLNKSLSCKGLRVLTLRCSNQKALIYIYRPKKLENDLNNYSALEKLQNIGYCCDKPEKCIWQLSEKLKESNDFPHEIGFFLGYPPEDVLGFMENRAENHKCVGCWKVYGDEKQAKKTFAKYKKCTSDYYNQWQNGKSIERLTVTV